MYLCIVSAGVYRRRTRNASLRYRRNSYSTNPKNKQSFILDTY